MSGKMLSVLFLTLFTGAAFATPPSFADVDTDGDGAISTEEASVVEGLDFAAADTDGNGSLSQEEYETAAAAM